ncbi:MAG: peptide chain release factor N(5)-glutamine methyltransferase [Bacteroidales bacterium]|nr:peptide chain release factor N(5)-glutamine methyltransferase [Bacteroidales bacterium]
MEIRHAELGELQALMRNELEKIYPVREAASIINTLFSSYLGMSRAELVINKTHKLSESQIFYFQRALKRLMAHEPLQYVCGKAFFLGREFRLGRAVLIPRPETEELVQWIIGDLSQTKKNMSILDIGTGSGCIAVSLERKLAGSEVFAIDNSEQALHIAGSNAELNGSNVQFSLVDILMPAARRSLPVFDVIVSNPPYVTPGDRKKMKPNVTAFEPHEALFVSDQDPLLFYREILEFSTDHLARGGKIYFECNEKYTREVASMMRKNGFTAVEIKTDMQQKERMVKGNRL